MILQLLQFEQVPHREGVQEGLSAGAPVDVWNAISKTDHSTAHAVISNTPLNTACASSVEC